MSRNRRTSNNGSKDGRINKKAELRKAVPLFIFSLNCGEGCGLRLGFEIRSPRSEIENEFREYFVQLGGYCQLT